MEDKGIKAEAASSSIDQQEGRWGGVKSFIVVGV